MKMLKKIITLSALPALLFVTSCGKKEDSTSSTSNSGSETQTTPNDSSGEESKKNIGLGEDDQKKVSGYPSNQSNLNSDSTSKKHDYDTTSKKQTKAASEKRP